MEKLNRLYEKVCKEAISGKDKVFAWKDINQVMIDNGWSTTWIRSVIYALQKAGKKAPYSTNDINDVLYPGTGTKVISRLISQLAKSKSSRESVAIGDTVHTPGGVAKVNFVRGSKVDVTMIDGTKIRQQYDIKDIQEE